MGVFSEHSVVSGKCKQLYTNFNRPTWIWHVCRQEGKERETRQRGRCSTWFFFGGEGISL